ncbi:hypothetical protein O181_019698 [Austropuccinia psidii MF-1]|uniref:RNA polymerase I-specific transcription initiation factor RRN3 n=1 Tax=Austropuccinia psidii MF-1 TaxID=1389203 RepID=A0A9Q3CBI8_9BASI|nr:hypothetical protein [Austropuccinia psidii MF-1]
MTLTMSSSCSSIANSFNSSSESLTSTQSSNSIISKSKKRARFNDETEDEMDQKTISTYITFNNDDPPLKKPRLQTDPASELAQFADNQLSCQGMYLSFIETAFAERITGKTDRYEQLLSQFETSCPPTSSSNPSDSKPSVNLTRIQGWIGALTSLVSRLDISHSFLVDKVLSLPWMILDQDFVQVYSRFVKGLVSSRSEWIQLVLEKIVRGFQYRSVSLENFSEALPMTTKRRMIYQRHHFLLSSLLPLVPTLPSILWPLLESYFPNKRDHCDAHVCYTTNLLKLSTYCPELHQRIIQLCVQKCLNIDVEIQVEVEEWEDDDGRLEEEFFGKSVEETLDKSWAEDDDFRADSDDENDQDDLDFDDLSTDGDFSDAEDQHQLKTTSGRSIKKVKRLAAKLDAMLRCMFDHLHYISLGTHSTSTCPIAEPLKQSRPSSSNQISSPSLNLQRQLNQEAMFDMLLSSFESSILRTRRSRHTQFILFWYASLQPSFADSLLATLVECALYSSEEDCSIPVATQVAAVSYIASLVSRARYIDKSTTRHIVSLLCARLENGLSQQKMTLKSHAIWYAIAQAVFYIFCFRWKDLLREDHEDDADEQIGRVNQIKGKWLSALKVLEKAILSPLNPLKFCASTVVTQFAKVSLQTNFIYCYNIIRINSKLPKSFTKNSDIKKPIDLAHENPQNPLLSMSMRQDLKSEVMVRQVLNESKMDSFFPFDPCKLPLSSCYLNSIYRVWEVNDDDEDDDDDDDDDDRVD